MVYLLVAAHVIEHKLIDGVINVESPYHFLEGFVDGLLHLIVVHLSVD